MLRISKKKLYERIASKIKSLRQLRPDGSERASGITQEELAEKVGVTRVTIANIETGRTYTPLHTLYSICLALDAKLEDVLPNIAEVRAEDSEVIEAGGIEGQIPPTLAKELEEIFKDNQED